MKKLLALLLALVMSVSLLAGCGGGGDNNANAGNNNGNGSSGNNGNSGNNGSGSGKQELVIGCSTDIGSLYPFGAATSPVKTKRVLAYELLFWQEEDGSLQPSIGKSWKSLGNGTYQVEIFDYIYDSAGNHMTADDIIFSLERYMEDGQNVGSYSTLTEYKAVDDYTVEFTFSPEILGQYKVLFSNLHCVTQKAWEDSGDDMATYPVGTGGYTLNKEESMPGATYVFEKRDDYWQTDEQYISDYNRHTPDKVTVKIITDVSTLAIALQNGEIDYSADISATDLVQFIDENGNALPGYIKVEGVNNSFTHLIFNCGPNSPCQDINLRRAICYAIDAAACNYTAYGSLGTVCNAATNPNLGDSGVEFGHDNYFPYDPDYAKELLAQSSYKGETIRILVQPVAVVSDCAPLVQAYCDAVGIKVELLEYDMAQYRTIRKDESGLEFDIELYGSAGGGDDYVFRSILEVDQRNYKDGDTELNIIDDKLQALYEDVAGVDTNSPEAVQAFLDYLEEQCYVYGMYYAKKTFIGRDYISNARAVVYLDALFSAFEVNK